MALFKRSYNFLENTKLMLISSLQYTVIFALLIKKVKGSKFFHSRLINSASHIMFNYA